MSCFNYPWTNTHELNLDWIIEAIKKLDKIVDDFVAFNKLEWKGTWNIADYYPKWSIVEDDGNGYLSIQPVPRNVPISDTDYWVQVADYDALYSAFGQRITALETAVGDENSGIIKDIADLNTLLTNQITKSFNNAESNILFVGNKGCQFTTINEAVDFAKGYCNTSNRVAIYINSGYYNEEIDLTDNPGIDLIGLGNVIIAYESTYPNSAILTSGSGYFFNLTLQNTAITGSAYAMHFEGQLSPDTTNSYCIFDKCTFVSLDNSSAGCGLGSGDTLKFIDCTFICANGSNYGLYAHNYPFNANAQNLELYNCTFNTVNDKCIKIDDARSIQGNVGTSNMLCVFSNCTAPVDKRKMIYEYASGQTQAFIGRIGEISLSHQSSKNNIFGVDYNKASLNFETYIGLASTGTAFAMGSVFVEDADMYNWTINSCIETTTNTEIKTNVSVIEVTSNCLVLQSSVVANGFKLDLTAVPK